MGNKTEISDEEKIILDAPIRATVMVLVEFCNGEIIKINGDTLDTLLKEKGNRIEKIIFVKERTEYKVIEETKFILTPI